MAEDKKKNLDKDQKQKVEDKNENEKKYEENKNDNEIKEGTNEDQNIIKQLYKVVLAILLISALSLITNILVLLKISSVSLSNQSQSSNGNLFEYISSFAEPAPLPNVTNTINFHENNNTNIILYEFSDFDCPYCDIWSVETYPVLNQTYISKGLINFVYEYFPLYQIHPYANITALYGSCIAKYYGENGFEKWYDFIFGVNNNITTIGKFQISGFWLKWNDLKNQSAVKEFIDSNLQSLGFNSTLIEECYNNLTTYNLVYGLENYFTNEYGIDGTPSFIIAVNTGILNQQSLQNVISTLNQLKSLGLQYNLYYTPNKKYIMIEFAGALPPQYFEEILNAVGAQKY